MSIANVDRHLQQAVRDGLVPGLVALAANAEGPCYSGALLMVQRLPANDPGVLKTLVGYEAALYAALDWRAA